MELTRARDLFDSIARLPKSSGQQPKGFAKPGALPIVRGSMNDIRIILHTSRGDLEGTLFASKVPMTAANFLNLAQRGFWPPMSWMAACWSWALVSTCS